MIKLAGLYSPNVLITRPPASFFNINGDQKLRFDLEWPNLWYKAGLSSVCIVVSLYHHYHYTIIIPSSLYHYHIIIIYGIIIPSLSLYHHYTIIIISLSYHYHIRYHYTIIIIIPSLYHHYIPSLSVSVYPVSISNTTLWRSLTVHVTTAG